MCNVRSGDGTEQSVRMETRVSTFDEPGFAGVGTDVGVHEVVGF